MTRKEASECLIGGVWVTRWGGLKVGLADNFVHNSMVHPHSPQCVRAPHDSLSITLQKCFFVWKILCVFPKKDTTLLVLNPTAGVAQESI